MIIAILKRTLKISFISFLACGKKMIMCNLAGPHWNLPMLTLSSWTPSLQYYEKQIFIVYKTTKLWCFVAAAQTKMHSTHDCPDGVSWALQDGFSRVPYLKEELWKDPKAIEDSVLAFV